MQIVYLAHTSESVRRQALYSALSVLAWSSRHPTLRIYTDQPESFALLRDTATFVKVSPSDVQGWCGSIGYLHRAKPCVLKDASARASEPTVFLDADTYATPGLDAVLAQVEGGAACMHRMEYVVAERMSPMMVRFRRRLRRSRFRGERIDLATPMWNSGVVGLGPSHFPLIPEWLAFLDEVFPQTRRWVLEQFALSYVLTRRGIQIVPAEAAVVHYWNDKPAHDAAIASFLDDAPDALEPLLARLRERPISLPLTPNPVRKVGLLTRLFGW
jgi:hypothetical protein